MHRSGWSGIAAGGSSGDLPEAACCFGHAFWGRILPFPAGPRVSSDRLRFRRLFAILLVHACPPAILGDLDFTGPGRPPWPSARAGEIPPVEIPRFFPEPSRAKLPPTDRTDPQPPQTSSKYAYASILAVRLLAGGSSPESPGPACHGGNFFQILPAPLTPPRLAPRAMFSSIIGPSPTYVYIVVPNRGIRVLAGAVLWPKRPGGASRTTGAHGSEIVPPAAPLPTHFHAPATSSNSRVVLTWHVPCDPEVWVGFRVREDSVSGAQSRIFLCFVAPFSDRFFDVNQVCSRRLPPPVPRKVVLFSYRGNFC